MSCKHVFIIKANVVEGKFGCLGRIIMYCPLCKTEISSRAVDVDLVRNCEPTDSLYKDNGNYYIPK